MEILFSYYIVSIGIGYLYSRYLSKDNKSHGINTFLGFITIALMLYVLNIIFRVPLTGASIAVAVVSLVGITLLGKDLLRKDFSFFKHPLFILTLPIIIVFLVFRTDYHAHSWDELSHWITMPKQIFLHNTITSNDFLINYYMSYTPSWSLLLTFRDFLFSSTLSVKDLHFLPLFSSLLTLCALFDILIKIIKNKYIPWLIILTAPVTYIPFQMFNSDILIEHPMKYTLLIFIGIFSLFKFNINRQENLYRLSIILAFAYTLKHSFMTLLPIAIIFYIVLFYTNTSESKDKSLKILFYELAILTFPYFAVYIIWQWNLSYYDFLHRFSPIQDMDFKLITTTIKNRIEILLPSLERLAKMFFFTSGFIQSFSVIVLITSIFLVKKTRFIASLILTYMLFYYACLIWMYLTTFLDFEALSLASFERYMTVPRVPFKLFSFTIVFTYIYNKSQKHYFLQQNKLYLKKFFILSLYILLLANIVFFSSKIKNLKIKESPISRESTLLKKILTKKNIKLPYVLIIAQGGRDHEYFIANYKSIGDKKYHYRVTPKTSWGTKKDNAWRQVVTDKQMINNFHNYDILWIVKSDKWMDKMISSLKFTNSCPRPYSQYFIFKIKNKFTCIQKKEY